jgi:hypothetical protein
VCLFLISNFAEAKKNQENKKPLMCQDVQEASCVVAKMTVSQSSSHQWDPPSSPVARWSRPQAPGAVLGL